MDNKCITRSLTLKNGYKKVPCFKSTAPLIKQAVWVLLVHLLFQPTRAQSFNIRYSVDTITSAELNAKRIIKVHLPGKFSPNGKYPVIYVLDEDWMFQPAIFDVEKLVSFKVIPPCIVVGINSPDRSDDLLPDQRTGDFTESSARFNKYLTEELPSYIARKYSPSVFNILIGHSDGASFAQKAMTTNPDAFRGIICLSQNLFGDQLNDYVNFSTKQFGKKIYYYVASGTRDARSRLLSGNNLDSLFKLNTNSNLRVYQQLFEADHSGVAGKGLGNGLSFIFSDYYQPNDWDRALIDSLKNSNTDPLDFIQTTVNKIKSNYGVDVQAEANGVMSLAFAIVVNKEQATRYLAYRRQLNYDGDQFNSTAAQLYERINEYDKALGYWIAYLEDPLSYKKNFFYFRRPLELLAYKMNDPQKALLFAEEWKEKAPSQVQLSFHYFMAKISAEKNVALKKGKKEIDYFIKNYNPAQTQYKLEDAGKIRQLFEKK